MINIRCDIGKSNLDVYVEGKSRRYKNDKTGIEYFVKLCSKNEANKVVSEPTGGYEKDLLIRLHEQGIATAVVNPYYVRNFAKSYQDLAKILSEYEEKMKPRNQERKAKYCFALEVLTSRRDTLVETIKAEKLRLKKNPKERIVQSIESHIKFLQTEIKEIESEIRAIMETQAKKITEILLSEKWIGEQTSAILMASLPELWKLENRQITKLVGLAPMAHASGKMKANRHIRGGRTQVRKSLFMASLSAIRSNPQDSEFYKRELKKNLLTSL